MAYVLIYEFSAPNPGEDNAHELGCFSDIEIAQNYCESEFYDVKTYIKHIGETNEQQPAICIHKVYSDVSFSNDGEKCEHVMRYEKSTGIVFPLAVFSCSTNTKSFLKLWSMSSEIPILYEYKDTFDEQDCIFVRHCIINHTNNDWRESWSIWNYMRAVK